MGQETELVQGAQEGAPDFAALDDAQFLAQDAQRGNLPDDAPPGEDRPGEEKQGTDGDEDKPGTQDGEEKTGAEKPGEQDRGEEKGAQVDYAAFYQKIMGRPIAANGGKLQLRSAEEAVQLMQMGANYTRKMQEIAPHRKALAMLQEHGLLDAQKLDFLVALDKKEPEAIRKYLADSKIDPLELDGEDAPRYEGGKYAVDERHIQFTDTLNHVSASPQGAEFLAHADAQWDAATKQGVYDNPDVLPVLLAQKQSGVYDRIEAEVARQKTLGQLPPHLPFIQAYQMVGAQLHQSGAFEDLHGAAASPAQQSEKPPPAQVQPGTGVPKTPPQSAGANAAAAAISRGAPAAPAAPAAGSSAKEAMLRAVAHLDDAQFNQTFRL